jgi:uncharacterized LabA/DUF88 family protein
VENVCLLWDIENVSPGSNSLFLDALIDYAASFGRLTSARAYCDWSKPNFKRLAPQLARQSFYLVHVPRERAQKKSADMQLVSDALETLTLYGYIDTFVLITGDSDFRPLVVALRRAGKKIHIVCDLKNAAQDLLEVADTFKDYRELMPGGDEEPDEEPRESRGQPASQPAPPAPTRPHDYWFQCLAEAAQVMIDEGKSPNPGSVKTRFEMLNPNFREKDLGFRRWSDFVSAAAKAGYVRIGEQDRQTLLSPGSKNAERKGSLQSALDALTQVLRDLDGGSRLEFHEFSEVSRKLLERNVRLRELGFRQFKAFVQAAEARGLVESKVDNLDYFVRRAEAAPKVRRRRRPRARADAARSESGA